MSTSSRLRLALPVAVAVAAASVLVSACSTFAGPAWQVGDTSVSVEQFYEDFQAFQASDAGPSASSTTSPDRIATAELAGFMTNQVQDAILEEALAEKGLEVTDTDLQEAEQAMQQQQQAGTPPPTDREIRIQATQVVLGTELITAALDEGRFDIDALTREAYDADPESFQSPAETCAHVLLVRAGAPSANPAPTEADYAAAQTGADAAAARLATEDFEVVANDVMAAEDLEAQPGGDVGCLPTDDLNPDLTAILDELDEGEVSAPTRFEPFGYIIVKVDSINEATTLPFEDVQQQLQGQVVQQLSGQLVGEYIQEFLQGVHVVVDPRFGTWNATEAIVDPPAGASSPTVPTTVNPLLPPDLEGLGIDPSQLESTGP